MIEIAPALNRFASAQQADSVSPDDPILEIPLSEFQHVLEDLVSVYNQIAETVRDAGILRGKELARLTEDHVRALKAEKSPTTKLLLINAYVRQLLTKIAQDDPKRKEIALDSSHTRMLFQGSDKGPVSRKETIRAMRRAEKLWPALKCGHRPNDGRQTMRLTISQSDMGLSPEFGYCDTWQRSRVSIGLSL